MNKKDIEKILPHREPYLLLDEVEIQEEGVKGKGLKKITGSEYFFEGHFPGQPVMPGVLIVEAIAQTAMVIAGRCDLKLVGVKKVKFRHLIQPSDSVEIEVEFRGNTEGLLEFGGIVYVNRELAATGEVLLGTLN